MPEISYMNIDINSDRICILQILSSHSVILTIVGVYMPFFNGSADHIELYVEVLDILQDVLDTHAANSPMMIMGDFNAALPQSNQLMENWHRLRPFNQHSVLLYDFVSNNSLVVSNFDFSQDVNYTYYKSNCRTYIDHCMVTSRTELVVKDCSILSNLADNTSDHFPVAIELEIDISQSEDDGVSMNNTYQQVNWNQKGMKEAYLESINKFLANYKPPMNVTDSSSHIQSYVDQYCSYIVEYFHKAAKDAMKFTEQNTGFKKKGKHWWTIDCSNARNRQHFWFNLWRSCNKPRERAVYDAYKYSKQVFRKTCRKAFNASVQKNFENSDSIFKQKRFNLFWNKIRRARGNDKTNFNAISIETLEKHFSKKFYYNDVTENECVHNARARVNKKLGNMSSSQHFEFTFTEHLMKKYIGKLKIGCSPGSDGVTAEHIKYAINSDIVIQLCQLFTLCFQYGVVPFSFTQEILVPLLKKPTLDPTVPNNYRPVIVSNILSKIMELYILDECVGYTFNDSQFGFIQGRSTNAAISLAHDVASYCIFNGSPVFMCGLDAEGAFDAIPHPVLFEQSS